MGEHQPDIQPEHSTDFFAWTRHQAKLLRLFQKRWGPLSAELDLKHIAEEIEDLDRAELSTIKSLIRQILVHLIKAASDRKPELVLHWRAEAAAFHADLLDRYSPSLGRQINMQTLWDRARALAELRLQEHGTSVDPKIPTSCPYAAKEFVEQDPSFDTLLERLRKA